MSGTYHPGHVINLPLALKFPVKGMFRRGFSMLSDKMSPPRGHTALNSRDRKNR